MSCATTLKKIKQIQLKTRHTSSNLKYTFPPGKESNCYPPYREAPKWAENSESITMCAEHHILYFCTNLFISHLFCSFSFDANIIGWFCAIQRKWEKPNNPDERWNVHTFLFYSTESCVQHFISPPAFKMKELRTLLRNNATQTCSNKINLQFPYKYVRLAFCSKSKTKSKPIEKFNNVDRSNK